MSGGEGGGWTGDVSELFGEKVRVSVTRSSSWGRQGTFLTLRIGGLEMRWVMGPAGVRLVARGEASELKRLGAALAGWRCCDWGGRMEISLEGAGTRGRLEALGMFVDGERGRWAVADAVSAGVLASGADEVVVTE